ncbi:unnamed protein product [Rhizophagus irregularis]|uniref:F-box domain-containing protein n=1 Tax=Rhizophagus irregularis TaxID=588596 RepID=A0A2N1MT88_9GLOM|nr:hypothetical protein RhiirC2_786964 [Rhizophagus irregularis]CAB4378371.1 unnamed protein product [Rhizophagus irregularis]CAB5377933.1 unnamed protein product [Rhizophagus irregularis]
MISTLPIDCLNQIFECLEEDKVTLHSCLLVNRLWCRISVEILWRNIREFEKIRTLIACLPNESKDFLLNNGVTSILISKPPLFNYASFCKVLSIRYLLIEDNEIEILSDNPKNYLITKEILKMFMRQISSLEKMDFSFMEYYYYYYGCYDDFYKNYNFLNFINFPGAKDCLKNLSELKCYSFMNSEFFLQLSKICHNINYLVIIFEETASVGIKDLILSQNNLESISFSRYNSCNESNFDDIFNYFTLTKHSNTLTKLFLSGISPPSIFTKIIFSNFRILLLYFYPVNIDDILTKFLVNNGKNLEELVLLSDSVNSVIKNSINLAIAKYCPKLKSLYTEFKGIEELIMIFDNCQQLESIRNSCHNSLGGKKLLEIVAKYSPKNFHKLNLHHAKLNSKDLESFFISWKDRVSKRPFSFIFDGDGIVINNKIKKLIRKYKALDVINKFEEDEDPEQYINRS